MKKEYKEEIWKDVGIYNGVDFTGCYEVSNKGNVRALDRIVVCKNGQKQTRNGHIMKQYSDYCGYMRVFLKKNGERRCPRVHRLVAFHFILNPDPEHKTQVNHIDEDKTNNCVENLEWSTPSENVNHGTRNQKVAEKMGVSIAQLDQFGNLVKTWRSAHEANSYGFSEKSILRIVNSQKLYHGYKWCTWDFFSIDNPDICFNNYLNKKVCSFNLSYEKCYSETKRKIVQLTKSGDFIREWDSIADASRELGIHVQCINRCLAGTRKTTHGYKWMYIEDYREMAKQHNIKY